MSLNYPGHRDQRRISILCYQCASHQETHRGPSSLCRKKGKSINLEADKEESEEILADEVDLEIEVET